jgi:8-oxo-dGTP diphosphatase
MTTQPSSARIIVGVGAVVWNDQGQVLLIRRANPPRKGQWSLPGGKVEFGEELQAAVRREVQEETGLDVEILGLIDVVDAIRPPGAEDAHYVLIDYGTRVVSGTAAADSDATEVQWVSYADLATVPLWAETRRIIGLSAERHGPLA